MSQGLYLFCLTPETSQLDLAGPGLADAPPLFTVAVAGVTAVLASVALDEFCGPAAREQLADLAWVAPRALRHEAVIMSILRQAPVLPVRFGSVFSSATVLAASLERQRVALAQFFRETAGQQEWNLKTFVDRPQAKARLLTARLAAEHAQLAGLAPGKRYFLEQKIKGEVERELTSWLTGVTAELLHAVNAVATASRTGRLQAAELTGRDDEMFFQAALLVPDDAVGRLHQLTAEWNASHQALGLQLASSGPWPPYHFTPVLVPPE
jgi:hypothetical protein